MNRTVSHWSPITDLPSDWKSLENAELHYLGQVWEEQRETLESTGGMKQFLERLRREWAIETGLIERIYTLDRGVTQLLIEQGIDANLIAHDATTSHPNLVANIIHDHEEVIEGLFAFVKGSRRLSTSYIKELHSVLCRHQRETEAYDQFGNLLKVPLKRGVYKITPNNPVRENGVLHLYCPPEQVASEMDTLVEIYQEHISLNVPPEIEAAWLHHRFTQIHPFQDGNGRVARALATLVFLRSGWFPLTITNRHREEYLNTLESADEGDLHPLVNLFATIQRRTFTEALGIAREVDREQQIDQVISSVRRDFTRRRQETYAEWEQAKTSATILLDITTTRLEEISQSLTLELGEFSQHYRFFVDQEPADGDRTHYFRAQIISTAQHLGYYANINDYHSWTRLVLRTDDQSEILISFHTIGREYRGLIAASGTYFRRSETEEGPSYFTDAECLNSDLFQINYLEDIESTETRYHNWLNNTLIMGLEVWRSSL